MAPTLSPVQSALVRAFLADIDPATPYVAVRAPLHRDTARTRELRTRKHDYLAVSFDELGNALVLTRKGHRLQLIRGDVEYAALGV